MGKKWIAAVATVVTAAAMTAALATSGSAATATKCPSGGTPPPGSIITGGLEVDGFQCNLTGVTVYGGIRVDATGPGDVPTGYLSIDGSAVYGGIVVNGGGLDIGADGFFSFNRTRNPTTINGGVTLDHALFFSSADATIRGGLTMNGIRDARPVFGSVICAPDLPCFINSQLCASDVRGNVVIRDVSLAQVFVGDPGEPFYANGAYCDANTIQGSLFLLNSNFLNPFTGEGNEIEGNTVTGAVFLDHSTAEVWSNVIGGSLLCTNGTVIQPPLPGDPSNTNNIVHGTNTCT